MSFLSDNMLSILVACVAILIYVKVKKIYSYFADREMPFYPPSIKDSLNSLTFSSLNDLPLKIYERSRETDKTYLGYFKTLFSTSIVVMDPALIQSIMIKDFSHFSDHGFTFDFETNPLAGHLFNMNGDQWRTLRHKLVPTFTSGKLRGMVPIIEECADDLIKEIKQNPKFKTDTNLKDLFKRFSLAVIASCAFGIDPTSIKDPDCQFNHVMNDILKPNLTQMLKFTLGLVFPAVSKLFKVKLFKPELEDFLLNLTRDTMEMRKKSGVKRNDFIQLLLELKEKGSVEMDVRDLEEDEKDNLKNLEPSNTKLELTDGLLAAQVFVFLFAGFENVAYLVAITMYFLSKNPDIQTRVRDEVLESKSKHGGYDYQALRDMKLLEACVDESLRLQPPIFVLNRHCTKTYALQDGKTIEKGMSVVLPMKAVQNDNRYWKDPEKFNPERFLEKDIQPGTYMPFGDGPRLCIAQRLALIETKLMVAKLVENFELKTSPKMKEPLVVKLVVTTDADGGFWGSFKDLKT